MPDRVLRDELLESDRWLDLPSDTHRLVYTALLLIADDYGNVEGGPRRLWRWMHRFSQVKSEGDSIKLMSDLADVDLVRRYEAEGREYWHIPRFKNARRYWAHKYPKSPFPEQEIPDNQHDRQKTPQKPRKPPRGVGVGVGVGVGGSTRTPTASAQAPFILPDWIPPEHWNAWLEARIKARKPATDYAKRLAVRKLENLKARGESPAQVLMQSAFNGWADLYPQKEETKR